MFSDSLPHEKKMAVNNMNVKILMFIVYQLVVIE